MRGKSLIQCERVKRSEHKGSEVCGETVKNLFVTKTRDYVTEVDEQSIVLIKDTRDMKEDEELQTLARMIVDNMHTEAMVKVRVVTYCGRKRARASAIAVCRSGPPFTGC